MAERQAWGCFVPLAVADEAKQVGEIRLFSKAAPPELSILMIRTLLFHPLLSAMATPEYLIDGTRETVTALSPPVLFNRRVRHMEAARPAAPRQDIPAELVFPARLEQLDMLKSLILGKLK